MKIACSVLKLNVSVVNIYWMRMDINGLVYVDLITDEGTRVPSYNHWRNGVTEHHQSEVELSLFVVKLLEDIPCWAIKKVPDWNTHVFLIFISKSEILRLNTKGI